MFNLGLLKDRGQVMTLPNRTSALKFAPFHLHQSYSKFMLDRRHT
jgi:hypothetical protein